MLINPGLALVVIAGIYLASKGHYCGQLLQCHGVSGVAIAIGASIGAVTIPTAKRAEALAQRDVAASGDGEIELSDEYGAQTHHLTSSWVDRSARSCC